MNEENEDPVEELAIFQKGREVFDLVKRIWDLTPEDNENLQDVKAEIPADTALLSV